MYNLRAGSMNRVFYFGCWNKPGHHLWEPGGRRINDIGPDVGGDATYDLFCRCDGGLAPRRRSNGDIVVAIVPAVRYGTAECRQGEFVLGHVQARHVPFTTISWWDRCQGDSRPGCSSTIIVEGEHDSAAMLAAGYANFPHVWENLKKHGVELVEVQVRMRLT